MTDDEIADLVSLLAENPMAGDEMTGTERRVPHHHVLQRQDDAGVPDHSVFKGRAGKPLEAGKECPGRDHQADRRGPSDEDKRPEGEPMSRMAFERIAEGLNEALSVARGETKPVKLHVPAEIDVRALRAKLRMSQEDFVACYGFTINQIKDWEQGRARPIGGVRAYLIC